MVKIGVIGLGKMGCAIARRMRFKGINVSGWTRSGRTPEGINTFENLEKSHTICHLHCNNSAPYILFDDTVIAPVFELTYLRNDRINSKVEKAILPHKLDQANCRKIPDPQTPNFWQ